MNKQRPVGQKTFRDIINEHRRAGHVLISLRLGEPGQVSVKDSDGVSHTFKDDELFKGEEPIWDERNTDWG